MAVYSGHRGQVNAGGNQVAYIQSWSYNESVEALEYTSLGDTGRKYMAGIPDGSVSLEANYDPSDTGQVSLRAGDTVTVVLYTAGPAESGSGFFAGSIEIESIDMSGDLGSMVSISISGKGKLAESTL